MDPIAAEGIGGDGPVGFDHHVAQRAYPQRRYRAGQDRGVLIDIDGAQTANDHQGVAAGLAGIDRKAGLGGDPHVER